MIPDQATRQDAKAILELQKLAYQSEAKRYQDNTLPPLLQTVDEVLDDIKTQVVLKAVIDDRIIGSVRAYMENDTCRIGRLVVHPDFQNQGIGTRLMRQIEDHFGDAKRYELFTGHASAEALHLYERLGYAKFKRQPLNTHTLVFLEKRVV